MNVPQKHALKTLRMGGYKVLVKNDGHSLYLEVLRLLLENRLSTQAFSMHNLKHKVLRTEYQGHTFIIKIDQEKPKYFENRLWRFLSGPFYSRQMKAVNKAIQKGCRVVPDIYLVAEKRGGLICGESIIIMEYIEPVTVLSAEEHKKQLIPAITELHRYGLVLGDCHQGNFIFGKSGYKIIDLSWTGFTFTGKAQDIVSIKRQYGVDVPSKNPLVKAATLYIKIKKGTRARLRELRGKPPRGSLQEQHQRPGGD